MATTTLTVTNATLKGDLSGPSFSGNTTGTTFSGDVTYDDGSVVTPPDPIPPQEGITQGDWYVATNGSDSNNGTSLSTPFATIGKAASVVNPGQTVLVKGGTYTPAKIFIGRHATAGNLVTFAPYGTEQVTIDGRSSSTSEAFIQMNANYTVFKGFKITNAKNVAVAFWSATGAQIVGCTITGAHKQAVWIGGSGTSSRNNIVRDNIVTNCVLMNTNHSMGSAGGWAQGITLDHSDGSQIIGNTVYENWGEGIGVQSTANALVHGNTVYDNYSVQIYPDCAVNCEVSGNFVYWSGNNKWGYLGGGAPDGVRLSRELSNIALDGLKIFNNIVVATASGISYRGYGAGGGVQNSKFYCNTLVDCAIICDADGNTRGNEFKDNIISGRAPSGSVAGYACDYNCWDTGQGGSFSGSHDVEAAPAFTGAAGALDASAYVLKTNSPCKGKGTNVFTTVKEDYAKTARPSSGAFTIGAYN
jgi:parallel beta-helix repeat protein